MTRRTARPEVPCPCCKGTGKVEMSGVYGKTWALLKRQRREINGAALARLAGCQATAMNNRLVRLQKLGLAIGRWHGRERLWRAVP